MLTTTFGTDTALSGRQILLISLLVFIGYFLGSILGFALTYSPRPISMLWPANTILAAALVLTPPRIWWSILLAGFLAHCFVQIDSSVPLTMVFSWFLSNS